MKELNPVIWIIYAGKFVYKTGKKIPTRLYLVLSIILTGVGILGLIM